MKNGESPEKTKRPVARKGKRGLDPVRLKAIVTYAATGSKTAACNAVNVDPRHSDRLLNTIEAQDELARQLQEMGMGPDWIARKIREWGSATRFVNSEVATFAMMKARDSRKRQLMLIDPDTMQPRPKAFGVVADTETQMRAVEMAAKHQGLGIADPEYGKRMFEAGAEAANLGWMRLIERLKPTLTPAQLEIVEDEQRVAEAAAAESGNGGTP